MIRILLDLDIEISYWLAFKLILKQNKVFFKKIIRKNQIFNIDLSQVKKTEIKLKNIYFDIKIIKELNNKNLVGSLSLRMYFERNKWKGKENAEFVGCMRGVRWAASAGE